MINPRGKLLPYPIRKTIITRIIASRGNMIRIANLMGANIKYQIRDGTKNIITLTTKVFASLD